MSDATSCGVISMAVVLGAASPAFLPHGYCFLWQPGLLGLNVVSDALIAVSYYSIPLSLVYLTRRRSEFKYNWLITLFGLFIVLCGTTHVLDVINVWRPLYWTAGYLKAATALVSIMTAVLLIPILPRLIRIPNPGIDALTQLPNRTMFVEQLNRRLAQGRRPTLKCAVLFIDLDGFKAVNDKHGHAVGDLLLVEIARRLDRAMRSTDTVARMSGDEFVVLLEHVDSASVAMLAAERAVRETERPFVLASGAGISISASVGVAIATADGASAEELIARADRAMYRAKGRRRGSYQLSDECGESSTSVAVAG